MAIEPNKKADRVDLLRNCVFTNSLVGQLRSYEKSKLLEWKCHKLTKPPSAKTADVHLHVQRESDAFLLKLLRRTKRLRRCIATAQRRCLDACTLHGHFTSPYAHYNYTTTPVFYKILLRRYVLRWYYAGIALAFLETKIRFYP